MSSSLAVSTFYDVDILQTNQLRRTFGGPPPSRPSGSTSTETSTTIMPTKAVGTPITGMHRNKNLLLERSMSEPVADRNANTNHLTANSPNQQSPTSSTAAQQQQQQQRQNVNSSRYKTELCRSFEENGHCKYGDKCQFAHGQQELRSLARHPKYKTELCRTFHTIGYCPYGPRCHFIHEDERKINAIDHIQQQPSQMAEKYHEGVAPPHHHHHHQTNLGTPTTTFGRMSPPQRPNTSFQLSLPLVRDNLGSTADSPPSSVTDSPTLSPTFIGDNDFLGSAFSQALNGASGGRAPPHSAPVTHHFRGESAFPFSQHEVGNHQHHSTTSSNTTATTLMDPLNIHTESIAKLSAHLQNVSLSCRQQQNQRNNNTNNDNNNYFNFLNTLQYQHQHFHSLFSSLPGSASPLSDQDMCAPPSPPDSLSGDSTSSSLSSSSGSSIDLSRGLRLPIFTALSIE